MSTLIIAEAGVNHNGSLELAYELAQTAKDCGADAVKFQLFKSENLVTKNAAQADYQTKNLKKKVPQFEMLKKLELNISDQKLLFDFCKKIGIEFMSSPFCVDSAGELFELGMKIFKIPSGEITNFPLLKTIAKYDLPTILSSGMSTMDEIIDALDVFKTEGFDLEQLTILHCNTEYPTPYCDVNLNAMRTIQEKTGLSVGYSDHTLGIEVATAATALGASVIEKHFTLDKSLDGPDHNASLSPQELKSMINAIRNVYISMGSSNKVPSKSELKNIDKIRKSIVAKTDIKAGDKFSELNITTKRPGTGISPMKWNEVMGRTAPVDFCIDEFIEL